MEIIKDLDKDIEGEAYIIFCNKLKRPTIHDNNTLTKQELLESIDELFPDHGYINWKCIQIPENEIPPITDEELHSALRRQKNYKAPGPDNIIPILSKILINSNFKPFKEMLNSLLL